MKGTARKTLSNTLSSLFSKPFSPSSIIHHHHAKSPPSSISRVFEGFFNPFSTTSNNLTTDFEKNNNPPLEKLKIDTEAKSLKKFWDMRESFEALGLSDELMVAVKNMNIMGPTESQFTGIPNLLEGNSVVLEHDPDRRSSCFAYLLPIIQLLRRDEATLGITRHRRPRAVVLCPSAELAYVISRGTKIVLHYVRGGDSSGLQDISFDAPDDLAIGGSIGLAIGTPSSFLLKIEKGEIVYDDIKYLVLEDADTMIDSGYGPDICKFYGPLKDLATKSDRVLQIAFVFSSLSKIVREEDASVEQYLQENLPEFL